MSEVGEQVLNSINESLHCEVCRGDGDPVQGIVLCDNCWEGRQIVRVVDTLGAQHMLGEIQRLAVQRVERYYPDKCAVTSLRVSFRNWDPSEFARMEVLDKVVMTVERVFERQRARMMEKRYDKRLVIAKVVGDQVSFFGYRARD